MTREIAADRFDAFLDAIVSGERVNDAELDPSLAATVRHLHATRVAPAPSPVFARNLRQSLLHQDRSSGPVQLTTTIRDQVSAGVSSLRPRSRRSGIAELAAAAIFLLAVAAAFIAVSDLSVPFGEGGDTSPRLAAPGLSTDPTRQSQLPTATHVPTMAAAATLPAGSPFPIGSTAVASDDVNLRDEPTFDENVVAVLIEGDEVTVTGQTVESEGYLWVPVHVPSTGDEGYVGEDFLDQAESPPLPTAAPHATQPAQIATAPAGDTEATTAVIFVVDVSGSMSYDPLGGPSKIAIEQAALRLATHALPIGSRMGIIAFNDQFSWVVPVTEIASDADRDQIIENIDGMMASGGSEIRPPLSAAFETLADLSDTRRHVVLLTDGKSRDNAREPLQTVVDAARLDGMRLSTVAVGDDADTGLLQFLAETGAGSFYVIESEQDVTHALLNLILYVIGS